MALQAYDTNFQRIDAENDSIEFIEAAWNRKLNEVGDFMVYMTLAEFTRLNALGIKYIKAVGRPEVGIIQKIKYGRDTTGKYVTLSGLFCEKLLDYCTRRKIVSIDCTDGSGIMSKFYELYISKATDAMDQLYTIGENRITLVYEDGATDAYDSDFCFTTSSNMHIGEILYNIMTNRGYVFWCTPNISDGHYGLNLHIKKSASRTSLVFSESTGNISELAFESDESAVYCNYFVYTELSKKAYNNSKDRYDVHWKEKVNDEYVYKVGQFVHFNDNQPSGMLDAYPYKIIAMNSGDSANDDIDLESTSGSSIRAIKAIMKTSAEEDMTENCAITSIDATVIQTDGYEYLENYDLGDTVTVHVDAFGINYSARIIEVQETHKNNMIEVQVKLGDVAAPNSYKKSTAKKEKTSSQKKTSSKVSSVANAVDSMRGGGGGINVVSVSSLPSNPEANTLYLIKI